MHLKCNCVYECMGECESVNVTCGGWMNLLYISLNMMPPKCLSCECL